MKLLMEMLALDAVVAPDTPTFDGSTAALLIAAALAVVAVAAALIVSAAKKRRSKPEDAEAGREENGNE